MREFIRKHDNQGHDISRAARSAQELEAQRGADPVMHLQRLVGNQGAQQLPGGAKGQIQRSTGHTTARRPGISKAGGDAPMPTHPLTEEERLFDLQADRFKDDDRLQQSFDNNPPIGMGASGPAVEKIQQAMIDLGIALPRSTDSTGKPDGIFGPETQRVVKAFQWRQGIVQDGIVGRQTMGELDGLFSGQSPPGTRVSGPETPGTAITVSEVDRVPKTFGTCGGFTWSIDWDTNARNGYLVQEINKKQVIDACGAPSDDFPFTPRYWEAWRVQEDGGVHGTSAADDDWQISGADISNPLAGFPGTKGNWEITGKVFFVNQLDPKAGFKVAEVPDAGILWSTTTQPGNLGTSLLDRSASDSWNCCTDTDTPASEPASDEGSEESTSATDGWYSG